MNPGSQTGGALGSPTATELLRERWQRSMLPTYATPALALVRGQGAEVWDAEGRRYVDLLAGIAVNSLGHAHPAIARAVHEQLQTLGHTSNLYATAPAVMLAERLQQLLGAPAAQVFFANSGAEANEAALKLARRHHPAGEVVAAEQGFHGRTLGALSMTGSPAKRDPFEPLPGGVRFVPYGDVAALVAAITPATAAVILEPLLGEAGVVPAPAGYLAAARARCDEVGALLILDEVQGGIGRTGAWFAFQHADPAVLPDVVTMAKGLGGGLPIGACAALSEAARSALRPGDHGSTFGGNPVCSAAALAVLDTIEAEGLLENAAKLGGHLTDGALALGHPLLDRVDGTGLWLGLVLTAPVAPAVEAAARAAGFLVNAAAPGRIRLAPPLVLSLAQADEFLAALPALLDAGQAAVGTTP